MTERRTEPHTESGRRLRWWREIIYIAAFYLLYSAVRNTFGSAGGVGREAVATAFGHAKDIIAIQDAIGLWFEPELQKWYLDLPGDGLHPGLEHLLRHRALHRDDRRAGAPLPPPTRPVPGVAQHAGRDDRRSR